VIYPDSFTDVSEIADCDLQGMVTSV